MEMLWQNHYQQAALKKTKKVPSPQEFGHIIQGISDQGKIGHLFVVDIEFDQKNASKTQFFCNKIYTPIFEKRRRFYQPARVLFSSF